MLSASYLFKYRILDECALSIIRDRCLYFAAPGQFNDPFDCGLDLFVRGSDEEMFALFDSCIRQQATHRKRLEVQYLRFLDDQALPLKERSSLKALGNSRINGHMVFDAIVSPIRDLLEQALEEQNTDKQRLVLDLFFSQLGDLCRTQFGICCLAGDIGNILMWSHYAGNHCGIALCFDASMRLFQKTPGISAHAVEYSTDRAVDVLREGWPAAFDLLFTRKSLDWAYERERRYISHAGSGLFSFKEQALRGVVLGCRFSENLTHASSRRLVGSLFDLIRDENRKRQKGQKLHVYQALMVEGEFKLQTVQIEDVRRLWNLYPI
jgi:hypothetical protein